MHHTTCITWTLRLAVSILVALPWSTGSDSEEEYTYEHSGLLLLTEDKVYKIDLETSEKTVIIEGLEGGEAIDYDLEKRLLLLSDYSDRRLYKVNLDTGNKTILATGEIRSYDSLSVDWIHGNVYWLDLDKRTINVVSLDGKLRKMLFNIDVEGARTIAVDPLEGWVFWSNWGRKTIERSGMDGTQRSVIVNTDGWPQGVTLDFDSRKVYWIEEDHNRICSSDYDGSNVKVIPHSGDFIYRPSTLDLYEDWIFWDDWTSRKVYRANILTGEGIEIVASGFETKPMGIRFLHSSKQPKGINYCEENAECSYWCLPAPRISEDSKNFTCICPNGMPLTDDQNSCTDKVCGRDIYETSGVIQSPNYPYNYPDLAHCVWVIHAPNSSQITLNVVDFNTDDNENCIHDFLEIREGSEKKSPLLGIYCGYRRHTPAIKSRSNTLRLEFQTDRFGFNRGFEIRFNTSDIGFY